MTPPLVYVAGKFTAPLRHEVEKNIAAAEYYGLQLARVCAYPVVPHKNTDHPQYEVLQGYDFYVAGTLALCRACDAILLIPGWEASKGARGEALEMQRLGRPIFYDVDDVKDWVLRRGSE
jgi:hypothetical protein